MQLYYKGYKVEMPQDWAISLSWKNQYFDMESALLGRSDTFNIPSTPYNAYLFDFPGRSEGTLSALRVRGAAKVVYNGGEVAGILYISQVAKGYEAVFYYGDNTDLLKIKDAGNIGDYLPLTDKIAFTATPPTPTAPYANLNYCEYNNGYDSGLTSMRMPTVKASYLLSRCANYFNVSLSNIGTHNEYIILNTLNGQANIETVTAVVDANGITFSGDSESYFASAIVSTLNDGNNQVNYLHGLRCLKPCKLHITFTNTHTIGDMGDNIHYLQEQGVLIYNGGYDANYNRYRQLFVSNFDASIAGKNNEQNVDFTIDCEINHFVAFYQKIEYKQHIWNGVINLTISYRYVIDYHTTATIDVNNTDTVTAGADYYLRPNLPQITFLELLRLVCAWEGGTLIYRNGSFTLGDYTFNDLLATELHPIGGDRAVKLSVGVGNFARHNRVLWDSNEDVDAQAKSITETDYPIISDVLSENKEIFKGKVSQTGIYLANSNSAFPYPAKFTCVGVDNNNNKVYTLPSKPAIADSLYFNNLYMVLYTRLTQVWYANSKGLRAICDYSLKAEMEVLMPAYEFLALTEKTAYTWNNCWWCVYDAEWSSGVAKLKLQRYK